MLSAKSFVGSATPLRAAVPSGASQAVNRRCVTAMAKKKGIRVIITLECTEAKEAGATPSRYTTQKSRKNTPDRLEIMKYNPYLRRHTLHRELKK
ncbi:unnamed protein product [Pedinophyceae sp. YPF-701]|nr:unnamed protein product [Pedinophyceae sp. YPF-701]